MQYFCNALLLFIISPCQILLETETLLLRSLRCSDEQRRMLTIHVTEQQISSEMLWQKNSQRLVPKQLLPLTKEDTKPRACTVPELVPTKQYTII